jgi:hypothetical protein
MKHFLRLLTVFTISICQVSFLSAQIKAAALPSFRLIPSEKFTFRSFVDCNMASTWIGDSFRIFPGKYGEDPLWGYSHELKYTSGKTVDEVFSKDTSDFIEPQMPENAPPGSEGLHGAVWFETLYQVP